MITEFIRYVRHCHLTLPNSNRRRHHLSACSTSALPQNKVAATSYWLDAMYGLPVLRYPQKKELSGARSIYRTVSRVLIVADASFCALHSSAHPVVLRRASLRLHAWQLTAASLHLPPGVQGKRVASLIPSLTQLVARLRRAVGPNVPYL